MKPHRLLVISMLIALLAGTAVAEEKNSAVERYKQARAGKRAAERFLNAKDALDQSSDASTINEAAQDTVRYAANSQDAASAVSAIDDALPRLAKDSEVWRDTTLAKGRLLIRQGKVDEGKALFQNATTEKWENSIWQYQESIIDTGDFPIYPLSFPITRLPFSSSVRMKEVC